MSISVTSLVRSVEAAFGRNTAFEAVQTIDGPGLKVEAAVRCGGAEFRTVDYTTYESPWLALEEVLHGHVEFVGSELCDLLLYAEPRFTWVYDPGTRTAIRKPGRWLFEPIPGLTMLGEVSFLQTLTHDFLVRDLGETSFDGRTVRRIALKPKQPYRSRLLSIETYPVRHVTLDFDTEKLFPLRITFVPTSGSPAASIVGPETPLTITYGDVRLLDTTEAPSVFEPPMDARVFEESHVGVAELEAGLPFVAVLSPILEQGFGVEGRSASLALDTAHQRAFAVAHFSGEDKGELTAQLTLSVGNYVCRNMARLRATFSEMGSPASEESAIRVLDRSRLWEEKLPGIDSAHAPVEAFFEHDGVFWFLSATHVELDAITELARDLLATQREDEDPAEADETSA